MKNFKVVLVFALGTVLVFVFFMFFYGGGHSGLKTNQLQSDFHTIFLAMNMNFASKGYYPNTIEELKEYGEFESNFFSILYSSFLLLQRIQFIVTFLISNPLIRKNQE